MRILLLAPVLLLAGCGSFPFSSEPRALLTPYFANYRLRGDVAMQNDPGTGLEGNAPQSTQTFGLGDAKDDFGIRADVGDGFAGLRVDWYHLDHHTTDSGVLGDDYGTLIAGDTARMRARMDEWRVSLMQSVLHHESRYQGEPLGFDVAVGGVAANRDLSMRATTTDLARTQGLDIDGNAFYGAVRARLTVQRFSADAEYAFSPGLTTGDFEGTQHDLEARLAYSMPYQDVSVFLGYRYSVMQAEGQQDDFGWYSDLRLDGLQVGVSVTF